MIINLVLILVGGIVSTTSMAAFVTLQLLVVMGRVKNRPAFLLLFVPFFLGLAASMAGNLRNLLSSV